MKIDVMVAGLLKSLELGFASFVVSRRNVKGLLHILTCKEQSASDLFDSLLDTLEGWLTDVHTNPLLTTFLIDGLRSWQNEPRGMELVLTNLEPSVQYALQFQLEIGWYALLCGYITKHFESIQTVYYQQLGKRNSG